MPVPVCDDPRRIEQNWRDAVSRFLLLRKPYLLY